MNIFGLHLPITITIIALSISTPSEGRRKILQTGVSKDEQNRIVKIHNDYRLKAAEGKIEMQPRATNMKELCWDDNLARAAQVRANKMILKHDKFTDERWSHVGQNLAMLGWTARKNGSDWAKAIKPWFVEVNDYTFSKMPRKATGHYTQLVWAKTTHVGCGYAFFIDDTKKLKFKKFYVCNYGPGGNIIGMTPYRTGRGGCDGLCKTKCER